MEASVRIGAISRRGFLGFALLPSGGDERPALCPAPRGPASRRPATGRVDLGEAVRREAARRPRPPLCSRGRSVRPLRRTPRGLRRPGRRTSTSARAVVRADVREGVSRCRSTSRGRPRSRRWRWRWPPTGHRLRSSRPGRSGRGSAERPRRHIGHREGSARRNVTQRHPRGANRRGQCRAVRASAAPGWVGLRKVGHTALRRGVRAPRPAASPSPWVLTTVIRRPARSPRPNGSRGLRSQRAVTCSRRMSACPQWWASSRRTCR
ncbi:hypothetical protein GA0115240_123613 [Streptomyces sp. DvalAA-14]|nr:hypothetical protein GA0115240_123613 [Streptomyces sp. DvalAA-14]